MKITATNLKPGDIYGHNNSKKVVHVYHHKHNVVVAYEYLVDDGLRETRYRWYRQSILPLDKFAVNKQLEIERNG